MAKKLKVGDVIRGYRITKVFGPGMMAISYAAQAPTGEKVFFKQYKSPAPTVVWYDGLRRLPEGALGARAAAARPRTSRCARSMRSRRRWGGPLLLPGLRVRRERRRPAADARRGARAASPDQGARRRAIPRSGRGTSPGRRCSWPAIAALHEVEDRACRPEAGECLSDRGPDDRLRLPAQADRHGLLAAGRPARALARLPGLCRHRQLPLARAPDARRRCRGSRRTSSPAG